MTNPHDKLTFREKIGYGLGDCGANFVFQTQLIFLMSFYTDVFGIAASTVGTIFLVSRLFDAVNDPLIGALADRTETRWGKYRPWVLATAVPFAFFFVLAYTTPDLSPTGKVIWAFVTYNLLMLAYTANNIPYAALTGVITSDRKERASLISWRFLLAMTAGFFVQTFTPDLVDWFGSTGVTADGTAPTIDRAQGYQSTMTLWAVIAAVFFLITFLTTRERVRPRPEQELSVRKDLAGLLGSRTWLALAASTVLVFIYLAMRGSVLPYYFDYYITQQEPIGIGSLRLKPMGWFNGLGMIATMVGIVFSAPLSMRFGKRNVFAFAIAACGMLTVLFYFLPGDQLATIIGLQTFMQLIYGISIPLLWAMIADVADYTDWTTNRRATAMTFAATVFALKVGLSLGGFLHGWLLDAYGYVPNAVQTDDALQGIRLLVSVFPAGFFLLAAAVLIYYEIDRSTELAMSEALAEREVDPAA